MRRIAAVLLLLGSLLSSGAAHAQDVDARLISFGIGGGTSSPIDGTRHTYRAGFNGEAFVRFDLAPRPFGLRAGLSYQSFELQPGAVPAAALPGSGTGT